MENKSAISLTVTSLAIVKAYGANSCKRRLWYEMRYFDRALDKKKILDTEAILFLLRSVSAPQSNQNLMQIKTTDLDTHKTHHEKLVEKRKVELSRTFNKVVSNVKVKALINSILVAGVLDLFAINDERKEYRIEEIKSGNSRSFGLEQASYYLWLVKGGHLADCNLRDSIDGYSGSAYLFTDNESNLQAFSYDQKSVESDLDVVRPYWTQNVAPNAVDEINSRPEICGNCVAKMDCQYSAVPGH